MSAPLIENYRFKYKTRGKWIYVPNDRCLQRAKHIIRFFNRDVSFPDYFYHYRSGGHVAALHAHLKNDFFFKIDVRNFFYSIARNRVARAFAAKGLRGAPTYAKWSTVRSPYENGPGVLVSVYLDDFIGSHRDDALLREVYEDIQTACIDANLVPNENKLVAPSKAIVAFNCNLIKGSAKVTDERVAEFFSVGHTELARRSFENYLERVERANERA
jgi:hypothetical protein